MRGLVLQLVLHGGELCVEFILALVEIGLELSDFLLERVLSRGHGVFVPDATL